MKKAALQGGFFIFRLASLPLFSVHPEFPDEHRAGFRVENEGFFVVARKSRAWAEAYTGTPQNFSGLKGLTASGCPMGEGPGMAQSHKQVRRL